MNVKNCSKICHKQLSDEPTFATLESTAFCSKLNMAGIFPYPFYFRSNPLSEEPKVFDRRAGWSPEINSDPYQSKLVREEGEEVDEFCFQSACNTIFTSIKDPKTGKCEVKECITLFR